MTNTNVVISKVHLDDKCFLFSAVTLYIVGTQRKWPPNRRSKIFNDQACFNKTIVNDI